MPLMRTPGTDEAEQHLLRESHFTALSLPHARSSILSPRRPLSATSTFAGNRLVRRFSANRLEGRFDQIFCPSLVECGEGT